MIPRTVETGTESFYSCADDTVRVSTEVAQVLPVGINGYRPLEFVGWM